MFEDDFAEIRSVRTGHGAFELRNGHFPSFGHDLLLDDFDGFGDFASELGLAAYPIDHPCPWEDRAQMLTVSSAWSQSKGYERRFLRMPDFASGGIRAIAAFKPLCPSYDGEIERKD
jgi:hypothetical protein